MILFYYDKTSQLIAIQVDLAGWSLFLSGWNHFSGVLY